MNIVDLIKNQLGGDTLGRISGMLGIGQQETRTAVDAGIPAILAGLTGLAGTNDGARRIDSALDGLDDRLIGNLGGALSSGGGSSIVDAGSKMLSSLFGGSATSSLGGVLSKFTGLGGTSITSLLGLLGPIILGVLKGQRNSLGLDAGGLAKMLLGQKSNIMNAMPAGLGNMLSGVPGLSGLSAAGDTARAAVNTAANTGRAAAKTGSSAARWALPLAAVLAIAGLLWWIANRNPSVTPPNASATPRTTTPNSVNAAAVSVSQVTGDVTKWFTDTTASLSKITDVESAKAALPTLQSMADKLSGWGGAMSALPADARGTITSLISEKWTAMQSVLDKAMAIPGVGDTLKPVIDQVRSAINGFTRA